MTHWLLNYKFWNYETEVTAYLTMYGEYQLKGLNLHDPMCELFPTEVTIFLGSRCDIVLCFTEPTILYFCTQRKYIMHDL